MSNTKPKKSGLSAMVDKHIAALTSEGISRNFAVAEAGGQQSDSSTVTNEEKRSGLSRQIDALVGKRR